MRYTPAKMRKASYNSLITLLLLVVFVALLFIIWVRMTTITEMGTRYTNKTSKSSLQCMRYGWDLEDIAYDGTQLTFTLVNGMQSPQQIDALIIAAGDTRKVEYQDFYPGASEQKTIDINMLNDTFMAYIDGCSIYPKTFTVR